MKIANILKTCFKIAKNIWVIRIYLSLLFVGLIFYFYKHKETLMMLPKIARFEIVSLILTLNVIAFICYAYAHYLTYKSLGAKISYWQTFLVTAFSRLGIYVPGKVWYATNYYMFSRFLRIDAEKIGKNFVINNAILFFTGALCSLFAVSRLPFMARYFLIISPFLVIVLIHPRILDKIFSVLMGKMSEFSPAIGAVGSVDTTSLPWKYWRYLKFIGIYFFLWFTNGLALYLCIYVFEAIEIHTFPVIVAAGASGQIIGLIAVFAPGGVGIREGIAATILSQMISLKIAVLAPILLRFTLIAFDFVVGGIAALNFMRKKRALEVKETGHVRN